MGRMPGASGGARCYALRMQHPPDPPPSGGPGAQFAPGADRAAYVQQMFGEISGRYDLLNRLMTGGRDRAWRRLAARELVIPGDRVVDVGCGTGDLSFAAARAGAREVLGLDFAAPMVQRARHKAGTRSHRVSFGLGDATALPLADQSVDVWCSAFVVRNIPDLDRALAEAYRVLRPGGRLGILEIPRMERGALRPLARLHFQRAVPLLGRLVSGHREAYTYLPVSVDQFLSPAELSARLDQAGFYVRQVRMLMLGTVALHIAERPRSAWPS